MVGVNTWVQKLDFVKVLFYGLIFLLGCTNYSVSRTVSVPPVLISVTKIASGHQILMRAANPEIFFLGYKLYVGTSENDARNPASYTATGYSCDYRTVIPNLPVEYSAEVSSNAGGLSSVAAGENANRVCKFAVSLNSAQYVSIRAITFSFQGGRAGVQTVSFSAPSNALIVP